MRAIQVKCSHCAAVLKVDPERDFVDCEYCGTRSTVQRRTRVFQLPRPVKVATVATTAPPRIAMQVVDKTRVLVSLLSTLITFAFIGGIFWFVNRQVEKATGTSVVGYIKKGVTGPTNLTWQGHGPVLLAHLDKDRILDPVGRVRLQGGSDTCHLAAFSGATGERLWQSEALGSYSDTYQGRVIQLDDKMFLFADPRGSLTAFRASDGGKLWSVPLSDKVERACRLGAADIAVQTADKSWQAVSSGNGAARKSSGPQGCIRLPDDDQETGDTGLTVMTPGSLKLPGMYVARVLQRGRGAPVAVGSKQPGTAVPMLARLERSRALWKAEVPAVNPLAARSSELASVTDSQACAIYETDSAPRLSCFDLKSGVRRWDAEIAKGTTIVMRALVWREGRFYLSSWGHLQVLEGATGRRLHLIGSL